jgi:hypothetical protein
MRPAVLLAWVLAPFAFAAEGENAARPAGAPPRGPDSLPSLVVVRTIRQILELPPERLSRIRLALERLERLSPEARADYATRLAKYEQASPEDRPKLMKEMRERGFSSRLLEHHLKTLAPDQANAERARFLALTAEERQDYVHKLAEKYAGEFGKGKAGDKKDDGKRRKDDPAAPVAAPAAGK